MEHTAKPPTTGATPSPRVDIGYFDPEGVLELKKTLSRESKKQHEELSRSTTRTATDATLAGDGSSFDFEKMLRSKLQACVLICSVLSRVRTISFSSLSDAGIQSRELGVMFENLTVVGLGATVKYQSTFASFFDPRTYVEAINTLRHPPVRNILSGFNGVVRPGEMLRA